MSSEYLSKKEVADLLKISIATVDRLMQGDLPHIKLSRRVLFRREDLDAWLATKLVSGTPGPPARRRALR